MAGSTPAIDRVRELADRALASSDGLIIEFTVEKHGTLKNAQSYARGFQTAFSSLRAKTRRQSQVRSERDTLTVDTDFKGPYDVLACVKSDLPDGAGYQLLFCPGSVLNFATTVKDAKTGEPLPEYSPSALRFESLWRLWFRKGIAYENANKGIPRTEWPPFLNPWNEDEEAWALNHDRETVTELMSRMNVKPRGLKPLSDDAGDVLNSDLTEWMAPNAEEAKES